MLLDTAGAYSDYSNAQVVNAKPGDATSQALLPPIALPTLSQIRAFFDALPHPAGATSASASCGVHPYPDSVVVWT